MGLISKEPNNTALFSELFAVLAQAVMQNLTIEALELTPLQLLTVIVVYNHPKQSMSALAAELGTTGPQLSRTIKALEQKALVHRQPNPNNRRQINVMPTAEGRLVAEKHSQSVQAKITKRLTALSPADRTQLDRDLADAIKLFAKAGIVPPTPMP
ncbi:MarR family winged helix-turn-helix transcriptional regulator [Lacticaseibacillus baoqingensis]|uniref:MarR family winged helix-turn-helix transcriptional regulator n=1 Tax=Lacticaseibacillus baoqingensis TaxID=2486013 RepID=A0ABW4E189_9LACO|nr:MarR family winged helix-turn-helix transcriptional regulator [Lacticaseibacillus baoqingensis]